MSVKPNKIDPHHVSQRVLQTKKEIEQLKLELQKLINKGVETDNLYSNTVTSLEQKNDKDSYENVSIQKRANTTKRPLPTYLPKRNAKEEDQQRTPSPKKVRHYNVEEAREFMRKQKEKRMETMKLQMKASQSVIDMRKEKLKELQKKSLELVQKNVIFKRERSRSRERGILPEKPTLRHETKKNISNKKLLSEIKHTSSINKPQENAHIVPDIIVNNLEPVPAVCSNINQSVQFEFDFTNICVRNSTDDELIAFNDLPTTYGELHNKAAIKIQSFYRGYYQRNLFKKLVKPKRKRLKHVQRNAESRFDIDSKEKSNEVLDKPCKMNVPFWLRTAVEPYPYNFISAVKKKLNLAVCTPIRTNSDIGVQISIDEPKVVEIQKTKDEIKKTLEESIKSKYTDQSFISHKCFDLNLRKIDELHLCKDKVDNLEDDCDIQKHSGNLSIKQTHSKNQPVYLLGSESSESDTSKNIPDLSIESTVSSLHSKNISDTSDYKLEINIENLKKLKLKERKYDLMENTMHILNERSLEEDRILLREVPKIAEYIESSKLENVQTDLGSNLSAKSKNISHKSIIKNNETASNSSIKSNSTDNIVSHRSNKSENNIDISHVNKSKFSNSISQRFSKSENSVQNATKTSANKSNKSDDLISSRNIKSESNVPSILQAETKKALSNKDVESDDNLKSFLDYMSSVQESKKSLHRKSTSSKNSSSFNSLHTKTPKTSESIQNSVETEKGNATDENYSSNFSNSTSSVTSSVPLLKRPSLTLTTSENVVLSVAQEETKNPIPIKPGEIKCIETKTNTNQIHLKFEAELHLLNDFNESLRQFMAVEKSLLELKSRSQQNIIIHQNQDTQTTAPFQKDSPRDSDDTIARDAPKSQATQKSVPTINYRRGSEVIEELQEDNNNCTFNDDRSIVTGLELSQLNESVDTTMDVSVSHASFPVNDVSFNNNVYVGFSVGMFDQLIRDEDARIENLKTILKIREKALLDRTKGELAWLEIQKKQLIETGQLHEASLLKKKQRGIIIKLQHEKQEMQRLKQIQKAASKERKIILKEQRNMIKAQLSNNNTLPKIRRTVHRERRHLGPVKVYNLHRETINTETSISRKSSVAEEIIITSRSESIVGQISEEATLDPENSLILNATFKTVVSKRTEEAKQSLLMREAALQKRKKAAEDLLQWHQRLLEEERKIAELEMAANTIIKQVPVNSGDAPCKIEDEKFNFKGSQLNLLWTNMTGRDEKKFKDEETYALNQIALERFCKDAKKNSDAIPSKNIITSDCSTQSKDSRSIKSLISEDKSSSESIRSEIIDNKLESNVNGAGDNTCSYSSEFDSPEIIEEAIESPDENLQKSNSSLHTEVLVNEIDKSKSTLNEIMQNISNITDEISAIYKLSSVANTIKEETTPQSMKITEDKNADVETEMTNELSEDNDEPSNKDDTLSSSVQSEIIKSLTELISSQNACQDINPEQEHNIIETPESVRSKNTATDSQGTTASNIELCTVSNRAEYAANKSDNGVQSEMSLNNKSSEESSKHSATEEFSNENTTIDTKNSTINAAEKDNKISNDTLDGIQSENNKSVITSNSSPTNNSNTIQNDVVNVEESQSELSETQSRSATQNILDLSYGFIGVRTKEPPTASFSESKSIEDKTSIVNEIPTENGFCNANVENSFNEINTNTNVTNNKINSDDGLKPAGELNIKNKSISEKLEITNEEDKSVEDLNIKNKTISEEFEVINDGNKSFEETTISTGSGFEKSNEADEFNDINQNRETLESSYLNTSNEEIDISNTAKLSSQIENSDIINKDDENETHKTSESIQEDKLDVDNTPDESIQDDDGDEPMNDTVDTIKSDKFDLKLTEEIVASQGGEKDIATVSHLFDEEAEALFKKQLAIEQEIKELEQQQKEHIPYMYMREIPNKPPPPYTPPTSQIHTAIVLPTSTEQLQSLTSNIADKLFKAYENGSIEHVFANTAENLKLLHEISVDKECYEFVFDLCKEIAIEHYKQFVEETGPSWMIINRKSLGKRKPFNGNNLGEYLFKKVKELLGFEKVVFKENMIAKWSRKKRDHVDELLVIESQTEESEWTNYDDDEIIVKNELTNDIMNMLLTETASVISKIFTKKINLSLI